MNLVFLNQSIIYKELMPLYIDVNKMNLSKIKRQEVINGVVFRPSAWRHPSGEYVTESGVFEFSLELTFNVSSNNDVLVPVWVVMRVLSSDVGRSVTLDTGSNSSRLMVSGGSIMWTVSLWWHASIGAPGNQLLVPFGKIKIETTKPSQKQSTVMPTLALTPGGTMI